MKIGLSLSRCVRDIVDGKVNIDDVLVVVARTDFNPTDNEEWEEVWTGYRSRRGWSQPEWANYPPEDEDKFRSVCIELLESGKLHQPRQFGAHPSRLQYFWLDLVLTNEQLEYSPAAKDAWERFQVVAGLANVLPENL